MWEWLVNYGGFLGMPSMKDISTIPSRYGQWRQEGVDAATQRERDLNELYEGLLPPPDPNARQDWWPTFRSPSSPNYRSWGQEGITSQPTSILPTGRRRPSGWSGR